MVFMYIIFNNSKNQISNNWIIEDKKEGLSMLGDSFCIPTTKPIKFNFEHFTICLVVHIRYIHSEWVYLVYENKALYNRFIT